MNVSIGDWKLRKAIEFEAMDIEIKEEDRTAWDLILEKYMEKYDPNNSLSISECVKIMSVGDIRNMYDEVIIKLIGRK